MWQSRPLRLCEPGLQLSHTSRTCRLHFSVPRSPLMWPCRPRDKWAQTWKTLRLAKNNMLSMDLLSCNANTKCSLCCNYIHFDMNSRGDHFLYSSVNACFGGSMRFRDILWLQEAVLTLGWKSTKKWSMSRVKCGDVEGFLMHSMLDIKSMNESLKFKPSSMRNAPDPSPVSDLWI